MPGRDAEPMLKAADNVGKGVREGPLAHLGDTAFRSLQAQQQALAPGHLAGMRVGIHHYQQLNMFALVRQALRHLQSYQSTE